VGSGSLPVDRLASFAVRLQPLTATDTAIARALRELPEPVIGRVHEGAVWLDLRALENEAGFVAQLEGRSLAGS
jgi:L-seryl-tRNA(Ser) seleniumtransferase